MNGSILLIWRQPESLSRSRELRSVCRPDLLKQAIGQAEALPVHDSILAIADANYFDWPVLPAAPSGLHAERSASGIAPRWELHGGDVAWAAIERRAVNSGKWERIANGAAAAAFTDGASRASSAATEPRRLANSETAFHFCASGLNMR